MAGVLHQIRRQVTPVGCLNISKRAPLRHYEVKAAGTVIYVFSQVVHHSEMNLERNLYCSTASESELGGIQYTGTNEKLDAYRYRVNSTHMIAL